MSLRDSVVIPSVTVERAADRLSRRLEHAPFGEDMLRDPAILDRTLTAAERRVLDDLARRIKERYAGHIDRLEVFGSRARGDASEESDIDVLVVLRVPVEDETRETTALWALAEAAMTSQHTAAPLSLIVLAEERFAELLRRERRFAVEVEAEGIHL